MNFRFPQYSVKRRADRDKDFIFCIIRKKWLVLTPEEFVRQQLLLHLTEELKYPRGLIAVEKSLTLNELSKRVDLVIFDREGEASILVECKSPRVKLSQSALDQAGRYNLHFRVSTLVVTNGLETKTFKINLAKNHFKEIESIPAYIKS